LNNKLYISSIVIIIINLISLIINYKSSYISKDSSFFRKLVDYITFSFFKVNDSTRIYSEKSLELLNKLDLIPVDKIHPFNKLISVILSGLNIVLLQSLEKQNKLFNIDNKQYTEKEYNDYVLKKVSETENNTNDGSVLTTKKLIILTSGFISILLLIILITVYIYNKLTGK
jgi:hypothetical protein